MLPWVMLIPTFYVGARFILTLPIPPLFKALLVILILTVAECHLIYKSIFGVMFAPEFPHWLMVAINWLFGSLLIFTASLLIRDLLTLIQWGVTKIWVTHLGSAYLLLTFSLILGAYGAWQAIKVPQIKTVKIEINHLPVAFEGYRLVQLTDLHASTLFNQSWVQQVVDKTNQLKADTILITGDVADGSVENRRTDVAPLAQLRAPDGVYAIPGNHEYYSDFSAWMQHIGSLGIKELINQSVTIDKHAAKLTITGVTDEAALGFNQAGPDLEQALKGVERSQPIILMDHRPGNAVKNLQSGVDLQLSGHTHGGMIYGLDLLVKRANHGFYSGLYPIAGKALYVSNGTGLWNGFAQRIGYPSEITLLILTGKH